MTSTSDLTTALTEFAQAEFRALVTVETAERLAVKAYQSIEAGDITEAKRLLVALTDAATTRTVTAVKIQSVSDAISAKASEEVAKVMAKRPQPSPQSGEDR